MTLSNVILRIKAILATWFRKPEYVYLAIATIGITGFVFITPPFQGPDEQAHYIRAQYIAHGYFIPIDTQNHPGISLPKSIAKVLKITFFDDDLRGNVTDNYEVFRTKHALEIPLNSEGRYAPQMITYNFVPYLPAIAPMVVSNLLNLSPLVSMYLGRLSLAAISVLLVFFSIKMIPTKKYLLVTIMLVPMMLFQQSMIGIDGISYALLAVFIAYVLRLFTQPSITRKQWYMLGILCMAIVCAKPLVYLFLPLVIILIKKANAWRWIASIAVVCAIVLVVVMKLMSLGGGYTVVAPGQPDNVNPSEQRSLIFHDPKRGLRVLWNSYMTSYGDDEVRGIIGVFGPADTAFPLWMTYVYVFLLGGAAILLIHEKGFVIPRMWRWFAVALGALYFIGVNYALYTGFSPVNFNIIYGIQGRYLLPLLILLLIVVAGRGLKIDRVDSSRISKGLAIGLLLVVLLALFITYQRYFLYTP